MPVLPLSPGLSLQHLPPGAARFCLGLERFCCRELGLSLSGTTLQVAFSGGPDSLALLLALHCLSARLRCALRVVHLNHGLREEAAQDAARAADIAARLELPFSLGAADVAGLARERKLGAEEAGRIARAAFFAREKEKSGADFTALGHQLNDLAEDSLMRLMRGSGWPALAGMQAVDAARGIVRPLLLTSRREIEAFTACFAVSPVTDSMNDDQAYLRVRVRQVVLPLLLEENPAFLNTVAQRWRMARQDEDWFASHLPEPLPAENGQGLFLPAGALCALKPGLRLRWYKEVLARMGQGQSRAELLQALDKAWREKRGNRRFQFPGGKTARTQDGGILFSCAQHQTCRVDRTISCPPTAAGQAVSSGRGPEPGVPRPENTGTEPCSAPQERP